MLERDLPGASRRRHHRCVRLHTVRSLSSLPGADIPGSCGRWVAGADFLAYLERYAERERLDIRTATEARRVDADAGGFVIATAGAPVQAASVVIATGYNHEPVLPGWTRATGTALRVVHASGYRDAGPYRGQAVLVVGAGNSGSDIAVNPAGGGARQVWLSGRSAPGVVPRRALGLPAQVAAIPLARAPRRLADAIAGLERRLFIGNLSAPGPEARGEGVFTRHARRGVLPILDHGFARAVRAGGIGIVPAVEAIEGEEVVLHGGRRLRPDAVVADAGIDFARMRFREPITGALRELRFESAAIASAIV